MRHSGPVLVYDGDCGFCSNAAHWVQGHWPATNATIVANQQLSDSDLRSLCLSRDDVQRTAWWISPEGAVGGHQAVAEAMKNCGGLLGLLGSLLAAPPFRWVAQPTYKIIARHRHLMPGGTTTCRLKSP